MPGHPIETRSLSGIDCRVQRCHTSPLGCGWNKPGVSRSRDLIHWENLPPKQYYVNTMPSVVLTASLSVRKVKFYTTPFIVSTMSPNLDRPLPLLSIHQLNPSNASNSLPKAHFTHQETNFEWLFFGPFSGSSEFFPMFIQDIIAQAPQGTLSSGGDTKVGTALSKEVCVDLEFGCIQVEPLLGRGFESKHSGVLICQLVNQQERLVRVHHDRNFTQFFLDDREITEGMILRLPVGTWTVTVIFDNDREAAWQQLWVAPRFHDTTEQEVEAWNATLQAQRDKALQQLSEQGAATDKIAIDWSTAKGCEGFVRVAKSENGYWWFLDPNNKPFYFSGVTSVNRAGTMGGRLAKPGPYAPHVDEQFNWPEDKQPFVKFATEKLQNAGFNGFGSWGYRGVLRPGGYVRYR